MKKFLTLLLTFCSFSALSSIENQCLSRLTDGFSKDGAVFELNLNEAGVRDFGRDHQAQAIAVVRSVLDSAQCQQQAINFGHTNLGPTMHSCQQLRRGRELSRVCYLESNLGTFMVTYDYLDNAYIVFKRWD